MLYALLQAEDYSLLGGSLLLFTLLAGVMIGTGKVGWDNINQDGARQGCGPRAGTSSA